MKNRKFEYTRKTCDHKLQNPFVKAMQYLGIKLIPHLLTISWVGIAHVSIAGNSWKAVCDMYSQQYLRHRPSGGYEDPPIIYTGIALKLMCQLVYPTYSMKMYMEFNLTVCPRMVKFMKFNISKFPFASFSYLSYHSKKVCSS